MYVCACEETTIVCAQSLVVAKCVWASEGIQALILQFIRWVGGVWEGSY